MSLGEKSFDSYKKYFDAGTDRYLLRHETATSGHYEKLHPIELSLNKRKQCLRDLKEIGFQVGCGFMVGDEAAECLSCMQSRMERIGYNIVKSRGDYK